MKDIYQTILPGSPTPDNKNIVPKFCMRTNLPYYKRSSAWWRPIFFNDLLTSRDTLELMMSNICTTWTAKMCSASGRKSHILLRGQDKFYRLFHTQVFGSYRLRNATLGYIIYELAYYGIFSTNQYYCYSTATNPRMVQISGTGANPVGLAAHLLNEVKVFGNNRSPEILDFLWMTREMYERMKV